MGNECKPNITYNEYVGHKPSRAEIVLYENAKVYEARGEFEAANSEYQKILELNANSAVAYLCIGKNCLKMGDFANALENFQQSIDLYPNNKYAYNGMGIIYQNVQKDQESIFNFQKAIEIDPSFSYPYNGLGNLYFARKKFVEAIPYYEKANKLDPDNSLILLNLASCQVEVGRSNAAEESLRKVEITMREVKNLKGTNRAFYETRIKELKQKISEKKQRMVQKQL